MRATWLAEVLRTAGLTVVEYPGWKTRGRGEFGNLRAVVWHHDASPPGDSPGVPTYMIRNFGTAAAQCWVARDGVWHVIAAGVAYHAGKVQPGKPGNHESIGVETDHTTGEDWPAALLASLRVGTAAILRKLGEPASTGLEFHKSICLPVGRKSDPDGLNLAEERGAVALLLRPSTPKPVEALMVNASVDRHDACWTFVLWAFLEYLGRLPSPADHENWTNACVAKGTGFVLAEIVNGAEAKAYRAKRAA
jgi:hypothetical protein